MMKGEGQEGERNAKNKKRGEERRNVCWLEEKILSEWREREMVKSNAKKKECGEERLKFVG